MLFLDLTYESNLLNACEIWGEREAAMEDTGRDTLWYFFRLFS